MNADKLLKALCDKGLQVKRDSIPTGKIDTYRDRLELELNLICDLQYQDYFLIVQDIVRWAKKSGILCSPGRGSVGGSLLAYLLDITTVDPIRWGLYFERFMNRERSAFDPPDIDLDFQATRRAEVKDYITDRYGEANVCSIGTHSYAYASNTIKDVAKAMGLDYQELNRVTAHKLYNKTLTQAYEGGKELEVESFQKWVDSSGKNRKCYDVACRLEGMVRHYGVHAAGVIIAPDGLAGNVPLTIKDGVVNTQWHMDHLQKLGYLKIDILGLSTLDVLQSTIEQIPDGLDLTKIPLDDSEVLGIFSRGETVGAFQFETKHSSEIMSRLGADTFEDIVVANTISRPAAIDAKVDDAGKVSVCDSYINRKHGEEQVTYPHESLEGVLSHTYGYPIYQESLMSMFAEASGHECTLTDAEVLRGIMKKVDKPAIMEYQNRFIHGAVNRVGATQEQAENMWEMIQASSRYTFNKSHAVAYSMISYYCMYLKHYYPVEFMAACMTHQGGDDKYPMLFAECDRLGVEVKPVDINKSKQDFTVDGGVIYCGFNMLKGVGEAAAKAIVENQPYDSPEHFEDKVEKRKANKRVREVLDKAGVWGKPSKLDEYVEMYGGYIFGDMPDWDLKTLPRCRKCGLCNGRKRVVTASGNDRAKVMIVGEAPGYSEDEKGRPFVGQSGDILRREWLPKAGLHLRDCYITNIVKCIPRNGARGVRKPTPTEQKICSIWLEKEIEMVEPDVIVAIGGTALGVMSDEKSILKNNGKEFSVITPHRRYDEIKGFALVHPAYLIRGNKVDMDEPLGALGELVNG